MWLTRGGVIPKCKPRPKKIEREVYDPKFKWYLVTRSWYRTVIPTGKWMIEEYPEYDKLFIEGKYEGKNNKPVWFHEDVLKIIADPIVTTNNCKEEK